MPPRRVSALKMAGLGLLGTLGLAAGPAPAPAEDKSFVLFMGADIDVEQGKKTYRVKNVTGGSLVIVVDNKPVEVPVNRGKVGMKVTPQLKLSDRTAVVKELKFERDYTPEKDPNKKWAGMLAGGVRQSGIGNAAGMMSAVRAVAASTPQGGPPGPSPGPNGGNIGAETLANLSAAIAEDNARPDTNSSSIGAMKLQEELDKKLFDAVRVTGEISAPKPVRDPYVVIVAQYREKDDPPGTVRNWFYAWPLDRLDETPVKVHFLRGGFPEGFELLKQQIHVYGAGHELGTNLADKNVALTRDEAHEYIMIDYLATNKQATLPPSVALGVGYRNFFPHFASEQLQQVIFVKVDRTGQPQGAFRNEPCTEVTGDDYLDNLVTQAWFKPALQAGKVVDGVARLKIADLAP